MLEKIAFRFKVYVKSFLECFIPEKIICSAFGLYMLFMMIFSGKFTQSIWDYAFFVLVLPTILYWIIARLLRKRRARVKALMAQRRKDEALARRAIAQEQAFQSMGMHGIDNMEGHQFEELCAALYKKMGYTNVHVTQGSGDHGVDILAEKDDVKYAIQCKRYSSNLGNTPIQEVVAGKAMYNCQVGVVITNRYFTTGAKELAKANGVLLRDRSWLAQSIEQYYPTPTKRISEASANGSISQSNLLTEDDLLNAAIEYVVTYNQASTSMLQRKFKIDCGLSLDFSQALRLVDEMEKRGIIGPYDPENPRRVLISYDEWSQKLFTP